MHAEAAGWREPQELVGSKGLVVLAPHPDDESLGCGGLIALSAEAGHAVVVVVLTDGRASHPNSRAFPANRLARLRRQEVEAAVRELTRGRGRCVWLGLPEGHWPRRCDDLDGPVARIVTVLDEAEAGTLLATWAGDPHRDHETAAAVAKAVLQRRPGLRLLSYPVWGRFVDGAGLPPIEAISLLDTRVVLERKARAVACHRSQMTRMIDDDAGAFMMEPAMQEHFIQHPEIFIREM